MQLGRTLKPFNTGPSLESCNTKKDLSDYFLDSPKDSI